MIDIQPGDDVTPILPTGKWRHVAGPTPGPIDKMPISGEVYTVLSIGEHYGTIALRLVELPKYLFQADNFRKVEKPTFDFREHKHERIPVAA